MDLSPGQRAVWEAAEEGRRKVAQAIGHAPRHAELFWPLYLSLRFDNGLGPRLTELVRLVIADATGCPICLGATIDPAIADSLRPDEATCQVGSISAISMSDATLTEREKAAAEFARKFGTDHLSIGFDDFRALHEWLSEKEIIELGMLCAMFLGFGRLAETLALHEPSYAFALASPPRPSDGPVLKDQEKQRF
jgi:alkylhydroperoxidase family enzyme